MAPSISHLGGRARVNEPGRYRKKNNKNLMAQGLPTFIGMPQPLRNLLSKRVKSNKAIQKKTKPKSIPTFLITVGEYTYPAGKMSAAATYRGIDTTLMNNAPAWGSVQPQQPNLSTSILLSLGPIGVNTLFTGIFVPGVAAGLSPGSPVNVRITNVTKNESQNFIMTAKDTSAGVAQEAVDLPADLTGGGKAQSTWSGTVWDVNDIVKLEILL